MGTRIDYAADVNLRGYRAGEGPTGLLVAPAFAGLRDFEMEIADRYAARGFAVLGADYYGDGWVAADRAEAATAMAALNGDRARLLSRTRAGVDLLRAAGCARVAAMGFCFGGKAVLDLARIGAVDAAVSMHGLYDRPDFETGPMPPVLLCHGWTDPLADPAAFQGMCAELEAHSSDWHAVALGGTGHAFTNPANTGGDANMSYVARSAGRAFAAADALLEGIGAPRD